MSRLIDIIDGFIVIRGFALLIISTVSLRKGNEDKSRFDIQRASDVAITFHLQSIGDNFEVKQAINSAHSML